MEILIYAIPVFVSMIATEIVISYATAYATGKDNYNTLDSIASLSMGAGNLIIETLGHYTFLKIIDNPPCLFNIEPSLQTYALLFLLDDFIFYWFHRLSHEIRILWASHVVHHSSYKYNLSTALRQSWTGLFFSPFFFIWLSFLGFPSDMLAFIRSVSLLYQFWIHTELVDTLPNWFEFIFNTPYHHRIHHASNEKYLDCNYGGVLIIWDRIFETIKRCDNEKIIYGITKPIDSTEKYTYNPFKIAFHEFRDLINDFSNTPKSIDKFSYIFKGPGWTPKHHLNN